MVPKWVTPIAVAAIAGVSIWLLSAQAPKKPLVTAIDNSVPDAYVENFTTYIMGENGNLRHEISASYMANFYFDDHKEFVSPQFIFYRPDESQWIMSAERGISKNGNKQIILKGKVTILRSPMFTGDTELKINTSELTIRPDDSYVETNELITITSGEHKLQSNGIRVYLNDGRIELMSRVRGVYVL